MDELFELLGTSLIESWRDNHNNASHSKMKFYLNPQTTASVIVVRHEQFHHFEF
jgi:hypothetical protein